MRNADWLSEISVLIPKPFSLNLIISSLVRNWNVFPLKVLKNGAAQFLISSRFLEEAPEWQFTGMKWAIIF